MTSSSRKAIYTALAGNCLVAATKLVAALLKGETENLLLRLPFKEVYMFRPGLIQPLHGFKSKTVLYRIFYIHHGAFHTFVEISIPEDRHDDGASGSRND